MYIIRKMHFTVRKTKTFTKLKIFMDQDINAIVTVVLKYRKHSRKC